MALTLPPLPDIPDEQRTPLVLTLLDIIQQQATLLQQLHDEIVRLKGHPGRPTPKPSALEPTPKPPPPPGTPARRPGSDKRPKTAQLVIHEELVLAPEGLPPGSRFKGYQDYVVQDLRLTPHNTRYRLQRWETPDGRTLVGPLPQGVRDRGHFGPVLRAYVLYQYHALQTTQPRLLAQLRDLGVDLAEGQLDRLLSEGHDPFHDEKEAILQAALQASDHVHADDTPARHQGHNGSCTHIGNDFFAYFASTASKSRINFLELLRAGAADYVLTEEAFAYMEGQGLSGPVLRKLAPPAAQAFADQAAWEAHLDGLGIHAARHRRTATEGALLGSVLTHGVRPDLVVVSDDAGQFDVLAHALCWVHEDRKIAELVPLSQRQRADWEAARSELWALYGELKAYAAAPDPKQKEALAARFDALCARRTSFAGLDGALKRLGAKKAELLLVLERPGVPLHNNPSERDIRDVATRRKVSGGTRGDLGRRCRDTFLSLKKTCAKLGVSFWGYLVDRLSGAGQVAPLAEQVRQRAEASPAVPVAAAPG